MIRPCPVRAVLIGFLATASTETTGSDVVAFDVTVNGGIETFTVPRGDEPFFAASLFCHKHRLGSNVEGIECASLIAEEALARGHAPFIPWLSDPAPVLRLVVHTDGGPDGGRRFFSHSDRELPPLAHQVAAACDHWSLSTAACDVLLWEAAAALEAHPPPEATWEADGGDKASTLSSLQPSTQQVYLPLRCADAFTISDVHLGGGHAVNVTITGAPFVNWRLGCDSNCSCARYCVFLSFVPSNSGLPNAFERWASHRLCFQHHPSPALCDAYEVAETLRAAAAADENGGVRQPWRLGSLRQVVARIDVAISGTPSAGIATAVLREGQVLGNRTHAHCDCFDLDLTTFGVSGCLFGRGRRGGDGAASL